MSTLLEAALQIVLEREHAYHAHPGRPLLHGPPGSRSGSVTRNLAGSACRGPLSLTPPAPGNQTAVPDLLSSPPLSVSAARSFPSKSTTLSSPLNPKELHPPPLLAWSHALPLLPDSLASLSMSACSTVHSTQPTPPRGGQEKDRTRLTGACAQTLPTIVEAGSCSSHSFLASR